jgi:hypothetical protein
MLVEHVRNVLGFRDADHAETSPDASTLAVTALSCSLVGQVHEVHLFSMSEGTTSRTACTSTPNSASASVGVVRRVEGCL